jgi:hypothetical protein
MAAKIVVSVVMEQKESITLSGIEFKIMPKFNGNHREKNPVIASVVEGYDKVPRGTFLICHHNCFEGDTNPFQISDNLFSIPFNKSIVFCSIDEQGELTGLLGNVLAERVNPASLLEIPITNRRSYFDRVKILKDGYGFIRGQDVLTLPYADYQIVYNINGEEKRIIKVHQDEIVATIK